MEGSAKTHHVFQSIVKESCDKVLTLKRTCETHWHCRYESIHAVKVSFKSICSALSEIGEEEPNQTGAQASILLKNISTFHFLFTITALESVFVLTNLLSKHLKEQGADILEIEIKIQAVLDSLKLKRNEQTSRDFGMK